VVVKRSASTCSRKASPAGSGQLLDAGGHRWRGHQGDAEDAAPVAWVTGVQGFALMAWFCGFCGGRSGGTESPSGLPSLSQGTRRAMHQLPALLVCLAEH